MPSVKKDCAISLINNHTYWWGKYLSQTANGQSCSYVQRSLEQSTKEKEERESIAKWQACVRRSIPSLDDRISPANVIASAVHSVCRAELIPQLAQSKAFADAAVPKLTAAVLVHRNQSRRPAAPVPKPAAPQPNPYQM